MNDRDRQELIAARLSRRSGSMRRIRTFRSGAAIRTASGKISGLQRENASYGLTICERVAATSAVAAGAKELLGVAVASRGACRHAACRQVRAEFSPNAEIVMVDFARRVIHEATLAQLLPGRFEGADIDRAK
jgi:cytidine deaminase